MVKKIKKIKKINFFQNFRSLFIKKIEEEFYKIDSSSLLLEENSNYYLNKKEKKEILKEIKKQNIKLISELYIKNLIPVKVIHDCCEFLKNNPNENKIILLCELIKAIFTKLKNEKFKDLEKILDFLEKKM